MLRGVALVSVPDADSMESVWLFKAAQSCPKVFCCCWIGIDRAAAPGDERAKDETHDRPSALVEAAGAGGGGGGGETKLRKETNLDASPAAGAEEAAMTAENEGEEAGNDMLLEDTTFEEAAVKGPEAGDAAAAGKDA